MGKPPLQYARGEVTQLAREMYERTIKDTVEPTHIGKFIVIDIETGEYDIDEDDMAVSLRMHLRKPTGVRFGMRIGTGTAGIFRTGR
jgi:hypothetical protein